jgi:hypothetical protein
MEIDKSTVINFKQVFQKYGSQLVPENVENMFISSDDDEGTKTPSNKSEQEIEDIQIDPK